MKIEDIEKAAKSYQEKDHDIWTGKGMATELQKAFKAGANWRIGSVWHDAKEVIIKSGYILVEFKTKRSVSYNIWKIERADVVSYWNVFMAENKIIRYAYIDDLLP